MFMRVSSILVLVVLAGFVAGCSDSPVDQYDAGKTAIENARLAEAELYAPEALKEATDSLNAAMVEMQKQDGRFALVRSYGKSEEMIALSQQLAEKAASEAAIGKERMRVADSVLIAEVGTLIGETNSILATAPKGKGTAVDLKVMKADLEAASGALTAATAEFQTGSYHSANGQLLAVKSQVTKVKSDIEAAIARLQKK
jgi:hypothetical protein